LRANWAMRLSIRRAGPDRSAEKKTRSPRRERPETPDRPFITFVLPARTGGETPSN
jgi:hypothetical protein